MPLTFPSHAAAVLPLKLSRMRLDGVALVVGSAVPDLPYAVQPWIAVDAHAWWAIAWFALPVTLIATLIVRRIAASVAAHMPDLGPWHLHDYGAVSEHRRSLLMTVGCAAAGAATHLAWDVFTHPGIGALNRTALAGQPWWHVLQIASTTIGATVTVLLTLVIGRQRLLLVDGPPTSIATSPLAFWSIAGSVWAVGLGVQSFLPDHEFTNVLGVRLLLVFAGGLALSAGALRYWGPFRVLQTRKGPQ